MVLIAQDRLHTLTVEMLKAAESDDTEAHIVADHLVEANLRGHDSHGVGMLPAYMRDYKAGRLVPNRHAEAIRQDGPMTVFDGGAGYGQVIAREATQWAIDTAMAGGVALFTLRNTHHIGRVGTYGEQAIDAGLIFIAFVNAMSGDPRVAPYAGRDGRMSTEPMCVAIPTGREGEPVVLDFATSTVALGKVRVAYNEGRQIEEGLVIDAEGRATTNPGVIYNDPRGALLPFGGHKGSGLALVCGLLGGALSGTGTHQPGTPRDRGNVNGMFAIVVDPARFIDMPWFTSEVDALVDYVKQSPPRTEGVPVLVAGEPERIKKRARSAAGVEVDATSWREICQAGASVGLPEERLAAIAG